MTETSGRESSGGGGPAPRKGRVAARRGKRERELRRARVAFLAPLTVVLGLLTLPPFLGGVFLSLTDGSPLEGGLRFVGLGNYVDLLGDTQFWQAVRVTVVFACGAVGLELVIGVAVAYVLASVRSGSRALRSVFLLPMAATPVATLFAWKLLLNPTQGPVNYVLGGLGLPEPDWLGTGWTAITTLIMVDVWQWTPFVLIIMAGALATLPRELLEAAAVDGASSSQRFLHIVLPHLRPYIVVAVLFRGIDALKDFDKFEVLTGGGPGNATTTLNMLAYRRSIEFLDFGQGAAVAMMLLVIAIVFGQLTLRFLTGGERV